MSDLWVDLFAPLTIVKLGWSIMALITLVECVRVWRPLYRVEIIANAEHDDAGLLAWIGVPVKIAAGLATIAALNLLAGLVSLAIPPPIPQPAIPGSWTPLLALCIPILFILAAVVTLILATILRAGYKRVVATAGLPVKAADLIERL